MKFKYNKKHIYSRKQRTGGVTEDRREISANYQVEEDRNKFINEYSDRVAI